MAFFKTKQEKEIMAQMLEMNNLRFLTIRLKNYRQNAKNTQTLQRRRK